ncbi:MAG: murein biosynthesis integral membrane protein MurJ [Chloroflexia bacterium]|nr:murein biosynthesis integral membrane protein MurJ [Chloroflexia bacterium]
MRSTDAPDIHGDDREDNTPHGSVRWTSWPRVGAPISGREWGTRRPTSSLAKSAGIVAGAFVVSRILGLVREIVLARQFGTSGELGAYVSAFRIPDLLFLVIMAGAFGSAFIPVFSGYLGNGEDELAWKMASVVLNMSGVIVVVVSAVTWIAAPQLVALIVAPDASPMAQQLTSDTMRILLLSPVFLGFGIAAKGILEGQNLFTLPAMAPIVYNAATILGAVLLGPRIGVRGVAVGVVIGAVGFLLLQLPAVIRSGMRYSFAFDPRAHGVSEVGRLLAPRLIGQAAFQINFIAVTNLAWRTGDQSVSALNYAWQLMMLPHGVLALSVSTVILPTLSRLWQTGDIERFRDTLGAAMRPLMFLSLPASVVLFAFRVPIVQTLFQTGAFSAESTALVAAPLAFLSVGLVSYALVETLTRAFYAMHDTRTPVFAGVTIIVLNIVLGVALLDSMGYLGLALALTVSTSFEALVLGFVLYRKIGYTALGLQSWITRVLAANTVTAFVALLLAPPLSEVTMPGNGPKLQQAILFGLALALVAVVYLGCAWMLRIPELSSTLAQFGNRIAPLKRLKTTPDN